MALNSDLANVISLLSLSHCLFLTFLAVAARLVYLRYFHPLSKVRGPFLASISKVWRLRQALQGNEHLVHIAGHQKYGPVYRISPNCVMVNDPQCIQEYWSFDRSEMFLAFQLDPSKPHLGVTRQFKPHLARKKIIASAFTMTAAVQNESAMDEKIVELLQQLTNKFANTGKVCDIAQWIHWAAFDIVMNMMFSRDTGFVRRGEDVNRYIEAFHGALNMFQTVAIYPGISKFLHTSIIHHLIGPKPTDKAGPGAFLGIAYNAVADRLKLGNIKNRRDTLQIMTEYRDQNGQGLSQDFLYQECIGPVMAGSDSTASTIRAAILYIAIDHRVRSKLLAELDEADKKGQLSSPVKFEQVKNLQYFSAVIKEVIRIHPQIGSAFFRVIPPGGKTICGLFLPGGTEIGMSQWALSRNKGLYGEDADLFRPERWLEDEKRAREYEKYDTFFAGGTWMCIGKSGAPQRPPVTRNIEIYTDSRTTLEEISHSLKYTRSSLNYSGTLISLSRIPHSHGNASVL